MNTRIDVTVGCKHDVPEIVELAHEQLPTMTYLHDQDSWRNFYRFGAGQHPQDNYLLALRAVDSTGSDSLAGFCWVDQSMRVDYGVDQPWWCINAIAIASQFQSHGLGRGLVKMVRERAGQVGVVSLFGLSHPSGFGFWEAQEGFALTPTEAPLVSSEPVTMPEHGRQVLSLQPEPGHRFFYASTSTTQSTDVTLGPGVSTS